MNRSLLEDKVYQVSVCAGMNQRIHQREWQWWARWDRACKVATGLFAIAGAALTSVSITLPEANTTVNAWSIVIAVIAAVLSVVLNVVPLSDWAMQHNDFFRRWTDFREEVDRVNLRLSRLSDAELETQVEFLDAKVHRISGAEPAPLDSLLNSCYEAEVRSRQPRSTPVS